MDCSRYKRQCDNMSAGWIGAKCKTWGGSITSACRQCYQQARSQEDQCERQKMEDKRYDVQTAMNIETLKKVAVGVAIFIIVVLIIFLVLR